MKNLLISALLATVSICVFGQITQTHLKEISNLNNLIKVWDFKDNNGTHWGTAYTIESTAQLKLYPTAKDTADALMVLSATYTSPNGKISEGGWDTTGMQVGNMADPYFKPNAFLSEQNGKLQFSDVPQVNSVGVYKLLNENYILSDVISQRTGTPKLWRFLVQQTVLKVFDNGQTLTGTSWMIVNIEVLMTMAEATELVGKLARAQRYDGDGMYLKRSISACLLDTGSYSGMMIDGKAYYGDFYLSSRSNLLTIP